MTVVGLIHYQLLDSKSLLVDVYVYPDAPVTNLAALLRWTY